MEESYLWMESRFSPVRIGKKLYPFFKKRPSGYFITWSCGFDASVTPLYATSFATPGVGCEIDRAASAVTAYSTTTSAFPSLLQLLFKSHAV